MDLSIYEKPSKKARENTLENESKKSSIFNLCLENTLPYLEIILENPYCDLKSPNRIPTLNSESMNILMTNCCLSALQTFRYLQQKDSYSDMKKAVNEFFKNEIYWDSNAESLYKRLIKKASKNSYLNQFMLYQNNNEVPMIGTYCKRLTLELFLNNQRYFSSKTIEKKKENNLFNNHYVFDLSESISQFKKLGDFENSPQNREDYNKLKNAVNKFLQGLICVEQHWKLSEENHNSNQQENEWIYYHNRELIFHSRTILSFLFDSVINIESVCSDDGFELWNDDFLTFVSIPLTYNISALIKNNPSILYHEDIEVNAAFSILLKTFSISLFNSCGEDLDKCCQKLIQQLDSIEKNEQKGKLFPELYFKEKLSLKTMKKNITAGLPIFAIMCPKDLFDFRSNLMILYSTMPKLHFDPTYNFNTRYICMKTIYGPAPLPKKDLFKKGLLDAKEAQDENRLKSFQKNIGQEYYYFLHQKADFIATNVLKSK